MFTFALSMGSPKSGWFYLPPLLLKRQSRVRQAFHDGQPHIWGNRKTTPCAVWAANDFKLGRVAADIAHFALRK